MAVEHLTPERDALILVDVQNDFCPGGALPVPEGDRVVPALNALLRRVKVFTVATRDWHPVNHCSFKPQGGIWPVHCVAGTPGAAFHPALATERVAHVISKATGPEEEAYSGFQGTELADLLHKRGIRRVFVGGLATDYCVKATALDAAKHGFAVTILEDAIRGVEVQPGDCARALEEMKRAGIRLMRTDDLT
ncbi:MAG TPA: nicotinamidase [Candidatus Methylomirabilis sp.]|jgi:nicotinamidase/pyrazinamidase|nr:nicotinamidase [Candidatus Methylomirabilis sp.]